MIIIERVQTRPERESAFTVIEVIVVALIIGILAAIAVPLSMTWHQAGNDDSARGDAVAFSMKAGYSYQHEGSLPTEDEFAARMKSDDDNHMALVSDGTTVCLLAYNTGGKEYTYDRPFVMVDFEALPEDSAPVSCPLDITAASYS